MSNILKSNETSPMFTLPLYRFLERYLLQSENKDGAPWVNINPIDAEVIAALDKAERFVHIQFTENPDGSGEILNEPRIYWIKSWRTSYLKWQLDKERSAAERKEANLLTENTIRLQKAMGQQYGIVDISIFRGIAYKIAKAKLDNIAAVHSVTIDKG